MEYEQKYKEALEKAKYWHKEGYGRGCQELVEDIFPELQESKDERIRKEIIETFKILGDGKIPVDINYADIFTWLEKQGGQKFAWSEEDEEILRTIISDGLRGAEFDMLQINWLKSLKQRIGG